MNNLIKELRLKNQSTNYSPYAGSQENQRKIVNGVIDHLSTAHGLLMEISSGNTNNNRSVSLVKTKLEEAAMWLEDYMRNG